MGGKRRQEYVCVSSKWLVYFQSWCISFKGLALLLAVVFFAFSCSRALLEREQHLGLAFVREIIFASLRRSPSLARSSGYACAVRPACRAVALPTLTGRTNSFAGARGRFFGDLRLLRAGAFVRCRRVVTRRCSQRS